MSNTVNFFMYNGFCKQHGVNSGSVLHSMGFNHSDLIEQIVKLTGCTSYLELGVYDGTTFDKVAKHVPYCVGVDIVDLRRNNNGRFFTMTTKEFFKQNVDTYDICFIDASHRYEDVLADFKECVDVLNETGLIILHDVMPGVPELTHPGYCGDAFRIVHLLEHEWSDAFNIVTMPLTEAGLGIVTRKVTSK
jgi:hypothetical protein